MNKLVYFCFLLTTIIAALPSLAHADEEPDANHWGARYEALPGQPAHGWAFIHMAEYRPGRLDMTLPGQPGHSLALQAMPGSPMAVDFSQAGGSGGPVRELPIIVPIHAGSPEPLALD